MHGVKVYLKSERDRLYWVLVILSGGLLLTLAYLLFDHNPQAWLTAALHGLAGGGLAGLSLLKPKVRRRWRYLPTLILLASAGHMTWMVSADPSPTAFLPAYLDWAIAAFLGVLGCAGPLTVGTRFAYFSPRRIYLRYSILKGSEFRWDDVQSVQLEDDFLEISLHNGKDIKLVPSYRHTQHLRSYLHEISLKAQSKGKQKAGKDKKEKRREQIA